MAAFTRILFHVDPVDPYPGISFGSRYFQVSISAYGCGVLRSLETFGKVRVEIIFPGKIIVGDDLAMAGKTQLNRHGNHFAVHPGQGTRVAKRDGADLRIGWGTK